jgi:GNAT superfamily N-acetyltransferase
LSELERQAFEVRRLQPADLGPFQAGMPAWNSREYAGRLAAQARGLLVQEVAWSGDLPVGSAMLVLPGHPEWSIMAHRENAPEVRDVKTVAAWRRRGVARALMLALEGEARALGYGRVALSVGLEPTFEAARSLYASLGYRHAHGPLISSTTLEAEDGSRFAVAGAMTFLVKDL